MVSDVYGAGIPVGQINLQSFVDLNTYANTGFTYTNLSNQSVTGSITVNGLVDTTQSVLENMKKLAEAANAWISYDTTYGQWQVIINRAGSSIASFTDSNIVGDIAISGTSLTQLNSAADVKYKNTDILDKDDFIKITIPSGDLYANEFEKTVEINLPFTNSQVVAAKVGLVQLKQGRVDKIIQFKTDFSYVDLKAGDLIDVTTSVYGFSQKVFRIITVSESFDDDGILSMDITALEYDATVYDYDIAEFDVETDDGILGIGSIGKPNTPTVTKTEQANVPKIVINGVVPSGIVDAVEFWITFDTGVSEANRNYINIGQFTNPSGATLTENQAVSYTYTGLQQSDFYVKIRGVNSIAVGPYSDPSGLIAYVPIVVADTLSDEPVSIGGQLMSLGLLTLLNNLDGLFKGLSGPGSLLESILGGIKEETGVDLEAGATVEAAIAIQDEGNLITSNTSSINFIGDGVSVSGTGNAVTVTIGNTSGGDGGSGGTGGTGTATCFLTQGNTLPPDKGTNVESLTEDNATYPSPDKAPITGYYFISYGGGVYADLVKGTGNIKLYKSNGTLAQTRTASDVIIDKNVVKIPFGDRDRGTDYYIIMDGGIVKSASGCVSPAITDPKVWNFNTPWESINPYSMTGAYETLPSGCTGGIALNSWTVRSKLPGDAKLKASRHTDILLTYSSPIVFGTTGSIKIYTAAGSLVQTINIADTFGGQKVSELVWISGSTLAIDPTIDLTPGTTYYINLDAAIVKDACGAGNGSIGGSTTIRFTVDAGPTTANPTVASGGSINERAIGLTFDRPVIPGTGNIVVYDGNNNVISTVASNSAAVTITQGVT